MRKLVLVTAFLFAAACGHKQTTPAAAKTSPDAKSAPSKPHDEAAEHAKGAKDDDDDDDDDKGARK